VYVIHGTYLLCSLFNRYENFGGLPVHPGVGGPLFSIFHLLLRFNAVIPNQQLQRYLRAFASWLGLNTNDKSTDISYNTRVELIEKHVNDEGDEVGWTLTLKELETTHGSNLKATWYKKV